MPQSFPKTTAQPSVAALTPQALEADEPLRRVDAPALLAFWHLLSLDAPTVAAVWTLAFAWAAGVRLPHWVPVLLALAAWSVYIGDRLLDARAGLRATAYHTLHARHLFHWRYRRVLLPLGVAAACAAAWLVLACMPAVARAPNSLLAVAALAYFSGVHSQRKLPRLVTKEFLVGVIFTAACALPTWWRMWAAHAASHAAMLWAPALYLAALAWLNCQAITHWEKEARSPGKSNILRWALLLSGAGVLLAILLTSTEPRAAALLAAATASALLLALLDTLRGRLTPLALRAAADLVLLTPALLLWARLPQ